MHSLLKPVEASIESVTTTRALQYALSFEASRSKHRIGNHTIGALQYALSFEASRSKHRVSNHTIGAL